MVTCTSRVSDGVAANSIGVLPMKMIAPDAGSIANKPAPVPPVIANVIASSASGPLVES